MGGYGCLAHRHRHPLNLPPVGGGNYGEGEVHRQMGGEVAVWEWQKRAEEGSMGNGVPNPPPL